MYAPNGIRTRVLASKRQNDWPDYTMGAYVMCYLGLANGRLKTKFLCRPLSFSCAECAQKCEAFPTSEVFEKPPATTP